MAKWAVFYRRGLNGEYTEVLGDRGILRLDGREGLSKRAEAAVNWAWRHSFNGYRLADGERLEALRYETEIVPVLAKGSLAQ